MSKNLELASHVLQKLMDQGVREFCICPGARNAPLITLLTSLPDPIRVYSFFEEREAAFFALGRIRRTGLPVAVVTTSGTAAGELLPATMEGYYAQLPLVLVTADRPRRYRGSGAPQAAEQVGILGIYAGFHYDLEGEERADLSTLPWDCPVHFNVCFDEPLVDSNTPEQFLPNPCVQTRDSQLQFDLGAPSLDSVRFFLESVSYPIVIVGMLRPEEREAVVDLILALGCPTYLEGTSGLREDPRVSSLQWTLSDQVQDRIQASEYPWDGVIRIGGIPTLRLWRDLDVQLSEMKVLSMSSAPFTGLGRPSQFAIGRLEVLSQQFIQCLKECSWRVDPQEYSSFLRMDQRARKRLQDLLEQEPLSEPGLFYSLSQHIPSQSVLYVGNSLPIREWDLAALFESRQFDVWASRGLNGIDGQVSTFLGYAQEGRSNWAIFGDLTALYDLPAPWILPQLKEIHVQIVIIHNGGGKIFSRMFSHPSFQNQHDTGFKAWADLWNLDYQCVQSVSQIQTQAKRSQIIEVRPDEEATHRFWQAYQKLLSEILVDHGGQISSQA